MLDFAKSYITNCLSKRLTLPLITLIIQVHSNRLVMEMIVTVERKESKVSNNAGGHNHRVSFLLQDNEAYEREAFLVIKRPYGSSKDWKVEFMEVQIDEENELANLDFEEAGTRILNFYNYVNSKSVDNS